MRSSAPLEETVLMEAGVPLELGARLEEREQRELNVSAWERGGTSRTDGGEMERLILLGDAR